MNLFKKILTTLFISIVGLTFFKVSAVEGASTPYDVPSSVRSGWSNTLGGKTYDWTTGRRLVYDVYRDKIINNGYRIVNRNFGQGSQPYINFFGWAVLAGHKRHTSTNHETYIVARKQGTSTTKIFSTLNRNLSATKDLEYNRQGPTGLYNECAASATNRSNTTCNMRYDNVGFDAYLPIYELFPNPAEASRWDLFIVKRVDNHIIYQPLILPFNFSNLDHNGGTISMSSGITANRLTMTATVVLRRNSINETAANAVNRMGEDRYFTQGTSYTQTSINETNTAIWYGVRSPKDNNATRWAPTAYWNFGGSQATIEFIPDDEPPEHRQHGITNHRYKTGNNYWIQPNDKVNIRLRGVDYGSLIQRTTIRLNGSGALARARHYYDTGLDYYDPSVYIDVNSSIKSYESSTNRTREATFNVQPLTNTHGHNYAISAWHGDYVGNNTGWVDTGMRLLVDGVAPNHNSDDVIGARYINGSDHWVRPNDLVEIKLRGTDADSKLNNTRLSLGSGSYRMASTHDWNGSTSNFNTYLDTANVDVIKATRTYESPGQWTKEVAFTVKPTKHGDNHMIRYRYEDNVGNLSDGDAAGWAHTNKNLRVDGVAPESRDNEITGHRYQSGNDYWVQPNDVLDIRVRGYDYDSLLSRSNFALHGNGQIFRVRHFYDQGVSNFENYDTSAHIEALSGKKTYESSTGRTKEVTFSIMPKTHGHNYNLRTWHADNVDLNSGWENTNKNIKVDGEAPIIQFRNKADTSDFISRDWDKEDIEVRLKFGDNDSGYQKSRYAWTESKDAPSSSEWSNWITSSNYLATQTEAGEWYLHVEAVDNVGNAVIMQNGKYKFNTAPEVTLEYEPAPVYENDKVNVCAKPYDEDGHKMNVELTKSTNGGQYVTVINKSDINNGEVLCYEFISEYPGDYKFKVIVDDGIEYTELEIGFDTLALGITGKVHHTDEWQKIHERLGNRSDQFFSGEVFKLEGIIRDHPREEEIVKVFFNGRLVNDLNYSATINLLRRSPTLFTGEFHEPMFMESGTLLSSQHRPSFLFRVEYTNGHVAEDRIEVEIIGNVFDDIFRFHQAY